MPKVVITHDVVDVDNWLKAKSERSEAVAGLIAAIAAPPPELAAAMERHGVVPPLAVYVEK